MARAGDALVQNQHATSVCGPAHQTAKALAELGKGPGHVDCFALDSRTHQGALGVVEGIWHPVRETRQDQILKRFRLGSQAPYQKVSTPRSTELVRSRKRVASSSLSIPGIP